MPDRDLLREILQRSGEHLLLVSIAIGLALLIALPLGVAIARRPRWAPPVLTLANVVQTIPSLAAAAHTPGWQAGFGYEFLNRADGYPGLAQRYGLRFAAPPESMDLGLTYRALAEGKVDLIAGDSTNGLIPALKLRVLRDDRRYFPPYDAVPVFHTATLRRHPELAKAVEGLAGRLDDTAMQRLNAAVDLRKQPVEAVVRRWRVEQGLAPRNGSGLSPAASAPGSSS
jgi:hypothetical protein